MEAIFALLHGLWGIISFVIKVCIYVSYFFPLIGARLLQWAHLWPTLWPFGNIY